MSAQRKKYNSVYRIYRRLRYLRYVKKLRKQEKKVILADEHEQEKDRSRIIREQREAEKISDRKKRLSERQEELKAREKLKLEFEQNAETYKKELADRKAFEARERRYSRHRRKRLIRFYFKACARNTLQGLKLLNPLLLPKIISYIRDNRKKTREFFIITIHSTILFTAAYFLIFLIGLLVSSLSGLFFDYKSVIYYNEVLWLVKPSQWFGDSVKMIYGSPAIVAGILAVFLAIIFSYIRTDKGLTKLFVLWSVLHGFNGFFGSLLIGSLFGRGLGYAIIWSYVSDTEKVIYSIISLTILILIGILTTKAFLISANSYFSHLENRRYRYFIWAQVIAPFLIGTMLIAAIMFPNLKLYDVIVTACLALAIIPIALGYRFQASMYFEEEEIRIRLKLKPILLALLFIGLYRLILGFGIPIG